MKIGITQRVEVVENTGEVRDCIDQNWFKSLNALNFQLIQIPNQHKEIDKWIDDFNLDGFILSGGNDLSCLNNAMNPSNERDNTEKNILDYAYKYNLPVLGICRGLQMINDYFGGSLISVDTKIHIAKIHQIKFINIFSNKAFYRNVNSFHRWGINSNSISKELKPFAWDKYGNIEGIKHRKLNWVGIMWHPERMKVLDNHDKELFINLFQKTCSY